jgi:catechol 2,3-dioxygenase-like lactoylglutathione lyase family enzyme
MSEPTVTRPPINGPTTLLSVFNMGESIRFYRDVLGFEVVSWSNADEHDSGWAMLKLEGTLLMFNTLHDPAEQPPKRDPSWAKKNGDVCLYFGCLDADAVYAYLQSKGWPAKPPSTAPYGMRQLYAHDPDGYAICFQHAAPA